MEDGPNAVVWVPPVVVEPLEETSEEIPLCDSVEGLDVSVVACADEVVPLSLLLEEEFVTCTVLSELCPAVVVADLLREMVLA